MQRQGLGQGDFPGQAGPDIGRDSGREAYDRSCDSDSCSIRSHKHLGHSLADVLEGINIQSLKRIDQNNMASFSQPRACTYKEGIPEGHVVSGGVLSKCYVFHVCLRAVLEVGFVVAQWKLFGFEVVRLSEKASWGGCPGIRGGYETFSPDSPSLTSSMGFRDMTSTTSLPTLDLVVGHQPNWTCAANCSKMQATQEVRETRPEQPKRQDCHKGERQPLKKQEIRGSKQRSAEVWI
ncbi:gap junction protein delta 6 [Scomber scombrus]|uniref:Gap junction protein delta 6 n=1 Tax=Scomber scombrus TaxID=13677 RepID=A0AAV1PMA1_SCOSC